MKVISSLDYVEVYMNGVDVTVENDSVKVYYNGGTIEIRPENKQIIIKDINVEYYELFNGKDD